MTSLTPESSRAASSEYPEMAGPRHQHPPTWTGDVYGRLEEGKFYVERADDLVIISDVLLGQFRAGESPAVKVDEPDVLIFGVPQFSLTITAENGVFAYRGNCLPCGCMVAMRQPDDPPG